MAQCPKCGRKLHIYNWKPNCPDCGANIMFASYGQQFEKDRRITEMTLARTRSNFVKFKCAFAGSTLSKLRILSAFIPIAGLFISFGKFTLVTPIYEKIININILGIVGIVTDGSLFSLNSYTDGAIIGGTVSALIPVLYAYLAAAACAILLLFTEILCFFNFKSTSVIMSVMGTLGVLSSIATELFLYRLSSTVCTICSLKLGAGFFVLAVCFIPMIIISALLAKKGVPYTFAPGDSERVAYYRRYKKGEIQLMDIPFPIYLSDTDKAERERLTKELFNIKDDNKKEEMHNV